MCAFSSVQSSCVCTLATYRYILNFAQKTAKYGSWCLHVRTRICGWFHARIPPRRKGGFDALCEHTWKRRVRYHVIHTLRLYLTDVPVYPLSVSQDVYVFTRSLISSWNWDVVPVRQGCACEPSYDTIVISSKWFVICDLWCVVCDVCVYGVYSYIFTTGTCAIILVL